MFLSCPLTGSIASVREQEDHQQPKQSTLVAPSISKFVFTMLQSGHRRAKAKFEQWGEGSCQTAICAFVLKMFADYQRHRASDTET